MSAVVCGKRSFFEDHTTTPISKKICYSSSSSSPVRFSSHRSLTGSPSSASPTPYLSISDRVLQHLSDAFPHMDRQVLVGALEKCNGDLDLAIQSLNNLQLNSVAISPDSVMGGNHSLQNAAEDVAVCVDPSGRGRHGVDDNNELNWVDLIVEEMRNASTIDDARARASRALKSLEKFIHSRSNTEETKENSILRGQIEVLIHENGVLKRAVAIQHERQKEYDDVCRQLQHLKQVLSQNQEQLRRLEVSNYALTMHLKQAQQSSSMPGHFHPDVF